MEERGPNVSRKERSAKGSKTAGVKRRSRYPDEDAGDNFECSGKHCRSCSASFIADCVAVCCCPCAVVNLLSLAFVKVPWMVGRKCLGLGKKKSRNRKTLERGERKKMKEKDCVIERDGNAGKQRVVEGAVKIPSGSVDEEQIKNSSGLIVEEEIGNFSSRFEDERVWLELYQVGHLGFGRVSFTGIQGKGN